jgi:hypothetical protein
MPQPRGKPPSKIAQLRAAMAAHDWERALRLAARFPRLGAHKAAIVRAHEAYTNPRFYKQIGQDPEKLKAEGRRALIERYGE